jgi:Carboxypeptidase regulatory-like domain
MNRTTMHIVMAIAIAMAIIGLNPSRMIGQNTANGSIVGKVTDSSGAALPGALVTVTSPQLEVPQVTTTSDAAGDYRVLDLPAPGVYHVAFSLQGFQTYVREGLNITVGFAARVDAAMQVGAVSQTVSVTGASPVVDTVNNASQTTIQRDQIADVPKSVGLQELLPMATGVSLQSKPDVGDSNLASRTSTITYGILLEPTLGVEGINTTTSHDEDTAVYLDTFGIQEAEYKTSGNNADVAFAGVDQVIVLKTGGNSFHGEYRADYENPSWQGNNITSAEAGPPNNLKFTNPLHTPGYYDFAGDIGGHIIRNKLWFYAGLSKQYVDQAQVNFFGGPDGTQTLSSAGVVSPGCWTCSDAKPAYIFASLPEENEKISWQMWPSIQLIASWLHGQKSINDQGASTLEPLPTNMYEIQPDDAWKGELQVTRPRWILDGMSGYGGYRTTYSPQLASQISQYGFTKGTNFAGDPSQEDTSNKLFTGINDEAEEYHVNNSYETNASFSYLPAKPIWGGTHQLKVGTTDDFQNEETQIPRETATGDYLLLFNNGAPFEITAYNYPVVPYNWLFNQAFYLTDTWSVKRVTLNLGVRWERYDTFYRQASTTAKQFADVFPATTVPQTTTLIWSDVVPRAGASWDVRGNGKTVVKGSFGLFGDTMGYDYPTLYNPVAIQTRTYPWTVTPAPKGQQIVDGSGVNQCQATAAGAPVEWECDATPAFLSTLPSLTPISSTGGVSQVLNLNLKEDKIYEYVARVERQLVPNVSVSVGYVGHVLYNLFNSETNGGSVGPSTTYNGSGINVGHPYSSYTIPVTFTDKATGNPVTIYTYPSTSTPAGAALCAPTGCTSNELLNTPTSRPDYFSTIEFAATKRYSKNWNAGGAFWMTKDHRWINGLAGIAGSPNDLNYPLDTTWNWELRINGIYNLPKGFRVSAYYRQASGAWGQRTEVYSGSGIGPTGAAQTLNQGSVTVNMGPFGQYRSSAVEVFNVEGAKVFTFHDTMHVELNFQVFNLLNGSGAVATNWQTTTNPAAPTFGVITSIESARVARIGGQFSF